MESPRNLPTPDVRMERSQMLNSIRRSEQSLYLFISKMAQNTRFRTEKPNTHAFFASLNNFRNVRGTLTDKQKRAINQQIDKYADYFLTLRVARPATVSTPVDEPSIHPENITDDPPLDEDQALEDERAGMQDA